MEGGTGQGCFETFPINLGGGDEKCSLPWNDKGHHVVNSFKVGAYYCMFLSQVKGIGSPPPPPHVLPLFSSR